MPLMIRLNRVIDVPDGEVHRYETNGYKLYEPMRTKAETAIDPEQSKTKSARAKTKQGGE